MVMITITYVVTMFSPVHSATTCLFVLIESMLPATATKVGSACARSPFLVYLAFYVRRGIEPIPKGASFTLSCLFFDAHLGFEVQGFTSSASSHGHVCGLRL